MTSQICFTGEADCAKWEPNRFKPERCMCGSPFSDHKETVVTEDDVRDYIGVMTSKNPCNKITSNLYLGGVSSLQPSKITDLGITHVVQTAKGLESFYPKVGANVKAMEESNKITVLRMQWDDVSNQSLDGLSDAVRFIHSNILEGNNVLVNCAQGKSRSSSLVVAYLMVAQPNGVGKNLSSALEFVKSKRFIAEPNVGFANQLREFEQSEKLAALRKELASCTK
eukprot:TRINITY_DN3862_c0_g1_i1.p1 TRINITY_DN3862_c0_g1~~TRINITY_DN3862_c0_g1_i1.p1  ORF type:complete len:225 (+),score=33.23 TRINITY_DN3862_c0_g1_i1:60-734(+)